MSLAIQEATSLHPNLQEPSLILSLGTGSSRSDPWESNRFCSELFPVRLLNQFGINMSSTRAWKQFMGHQTTKRKGDYFRYDISWEGNEPALDSTAQMEEIKSAARSYILNHPSLQRLIGRILAGLFYFELKALPNYQGHLVGEGSIFCRLDGGSPELEALLHLLDQGNAYFLVQGCHTNIDGDICRGIFFKNVIFSAPRSQDAIHIALVIASEEHPISGSPFTIDELVRAQQMDAHFGTSDHRPLKGQVGSYTRGLKRKFNGVREKRKKRKLH